MGKTALIVDDSRSARQVLKRMLETHSLEVDTAESAEDALEYLSDHRPDVIFMDHMMPGMDGFEAVIAIKNNPETATIPIMMYTSKKGDVYVGQARALGAVGVLPKEVEPVAVSKVLMSLRVISDGAPGSDHESGSPEIPGSTISDLPDLDALDQNMRELIEDLFDQQRAILRRDMLDSYESIATRLADEIRTPLGDEPDDRSDSVTDRVVAYRAIVFALGVAAIILGGLFWDRGQKLQTLSDQNIALTEALDQQQAVNTSGSIRTQAMRDDYQQSLSAAYAGTLRAIEWGVNQSGPYGPTELPLGDERLPLFEALLGQLIDVGFSGQVRIETHVGDFCLVMSAPDEYLPAVDGIPATQCDSIGMLQSDAIERGQRQSVVFANFINVTQQQTAGQIRFNVVSLGNSAALTEYPPLQASTLAGDWNAIAASNNRIIVSLYPD